MLDTDDLIHLKEMMDIIELQQETITTLVSAIAVLQMRVDLLEKGE